MSNKSSRQPSEWRGVIIPTLEMSKLMARGGRQRDLGMITQVSRKRGDLNQILNDSTRKFLPRSRYFLPWRHVCF